MVVVDKHKFFSFYMNSKGEITKRRKRMRKNSNSNSKVLKCILHCLRNGLYPNVLTWTKKDEGVFKVSFLHQKNPKWTKSWLSLFKAVEKTTFAKRYKQKTKEAKYSEKCKTRFRANLRKLCDAEALQFMEEKTMKDGSKEKTYKIINYSEKFITDLLKDSKVDKIIEMDVDTTEEVEMESQVSIIVPVEIPSKEISHYLCLSNQVLPERSGDTSTNDFAFPEDDENLKKTGDNTSPPYFHPVLPSQVDSSSMENRGTKRQFSEEKESDENLKKTGDNTSPPYFHPVLPSQVDSSSMENRGTKRQFSEENESDGSFNAVPNPMQIASGLTEDSILYDSFVAALDPIETHVNYGFPEEITLNMLNNFDDSVHDEILTENDWGVFSQNYASEFDEDDNLHSPGEMNLIKLQNANFADYTLPKHEESINLTDMWNAKGSADFLTLKNLSLSSTVGRYSDKAYGYTDA